MQLLIRNAFRFSLIKFKLPDLGQKIKEGTVKKLYVKEGDTVTEFQKLADVASDKQFTQITAMDAGVITKIYFSQEQVCQVGQLFLQISTEEQKPQIKLQTKEEQKQQQKQQKNKQHQSSVSQRQSDQLLATPFIRGLLKKHNIAQSNIVGTGANGRILQIDITNYLSKFSNKQHIIPPSKQHIIPPSKQQITPSSKSPTSNTIAMTAFERGMQKSMTQSLNIPHLYLQEQFDITEMQLLREQLKKQNKKVTLMVLLMKTFSLALKQHAKMNSTYHPQDPFSYTTHPQHNVSLAIDSPNGLVVPNVKNVAALTLTQLQEQLERLRDLAAAAHLTTKQLANGTICISNVGTIAGVSACPIILSPQVCIVAVGKLQKLPRLHHHIVTERKILSVTYGCDHRVIDGATVAKFSNTWKGFMEQPYTAMTEMK